MFKNLILLLSFIILQITTFSSEYQFPLKNQYISTIVGTLKVAVEETKEEVPTKEYTLELKPTEKILKNMWFEKGFKFSASTQKTKAPLIFILSGTGASYNSEKTEKLKRIFYKAGYHVISVSSVFNNNFLLNASLNKMPGVLVEDCMDLYSVMQTMVETVKQREKIEISDYFLTGYSLGGTHSAVISFLDSKLQNFNFKRVYMINPAVDLYYSAGVIDRLLYFGISDKSEIKNLFQQFFSVLESTLNGDSLKIDLDNIFAQLFQSKEILQKLPNIIGIYFNLTAININFITDQIHNLNYYSKIPVEKYSDMYPYFEAIDFAGLQDYIKNIAYPYYKETYGNIDLDEIIRYGNLKIIEDYLKNEKKIVVVTNEDDFILSEDNKKFLKDTFKERAFFYPTGGHCGNMFFYPNVEKMLKFFEKGEFTNEI